MSPSDRVILFGDSHAQPLVDSLACWGFFDHARTDQVFADFVDCGLIAHDLLIQTKDRGDMLNPILQREMEKAGLYNRWTLDFSPGTARVGLLFGYVDVHMLGFVRPLFEDFDEGLLREGPRSPSGAVHYAMLCELLRRRLAKVDQTVGLLKRAGFEVFLASSPPPSTDAAIAQHQAAADRGPARARLSVWSAIQHVMPEIAGRHGAVDLTDQSRFADADGFLLPQYVGDGIHGNIEYGREYLTDICRGLGLDLTSSARPGVQGPPGAAPKPGLARSVAKALARLR